MLNQQGITHGGSPPRAGTSRSGKASNPDFEAGFVFSIATSAAHQPKLLAVCPDNEWRLIVVLARYGGLRTPSEMQELKWTDVLWDQNKILITVQKKQHLDGHATRFVPIFPEIRPYLQAAWDEAEEGARFVVPRSTRPRVNLNTQMRRLIAQAGLAAWPRTFQNLRASRDTELANEYPLYLVNAWIGHTSRVAQDHYQMVTDEDFLRAGQMPGRESLPTRESVPVQIPVQTGAIRGSQERSEANAKAVSPGFPNETAFSVPSTGIEPVTFSSGGGSAVVLSAANTALATRAAARCTNRCTEKPAERDAVAAAARLVAGQPVTDDDRAAILAWLVGRAGDTRPD